MSLNLSQMTLLTFFTGLCILIIYAAFDVRTRRVPNEIIVLCSVVGAIVGILTGSMIGNWILHASAIPSFAILGYLLFRLESIGGGDAKAGISLGIVSPGLVLGSWTIPVFEGVLVSCLELCIMLALGYAYSRSKSGESITPLIPGLLVGYLLVQLLALL